jgi:hypothetical protein
VLLTLAAGAVAFRTRTLAEARALT